MTTSYTISGASEHDWPAVLTLLEEINLDREGVAIQQFVVSRNDTSLIGAGRLRKHTDATELCSLGVKESHRNIGVGKALVKFLLEQAGDEVYVVTDIPDYFGKLGFKPSEHYPASMEDKRLRCIVQYECLQPVVMSIRTI